MAFSPRCKLADNLAALQIALSLEESERPDAAQMAALRAYAGLSGIKIGMYGESTLEEWQKKCHPR
jgi:hypothetical protein